MEKNIDFGTVADLYDRYVQWDVDIPFFRGVCESTNGDVLELMCGTGRVSLPLIRRGLSLTCANYSSEMLEVLCERATPGRDAVLRVWSAGNYLSTEGIGDALQEYEVARPDGAVIERRSLSVCFAVPDRTEFEQELNVAGFRIRQLWGNYHRSPFHPELSPYMIWGLDVCGTA